jgi:hypothetical protein
MISRQSFIFTIGFDGDTAVVDKRAKAKYGRYSTMELAQAGFFRAAYASAVFEERPEELKSFLDYYNSLAGTAYSPADDVTRLFGVAKEKTVKTIEL